MRMRCKHAWGQSYRTRLGHIAILLPLLVVVALIQVLPQVDPPDTAFHEDRAPIITKSRAIAAPVFCFARGRDFVVAARATKSPTTGEWLSIPQHRSSLSLAILHSAILCKSDLSDLDSRSDHIVRRFAPFTVNRPTCGSKRRESC